MNIESVSDGYQEDQICIGLVLDAYQIGTKSVSAAQ